MQAQKVGLRKVRDLQDMIGKGAEIRPIERPYLRLADDPRVLSHSDLDAASFAQLELKRAAARRFRDEFRHQAMRANVPVGTVMAAGGLGGGSFVRDGEVVGDYDAALARSMAVDEAARMNAIEKSKASIQDIQAQAEEAANHPRSKTAVERARSVGYLAGSLPVGAVTGSGMLADVSGWFAANSAEDAAVIAAQIANLISEARAKRDSHQKKLYDHQIPTASLSREEA